MRQFARSTSAGLAATYLCLIMILSIGFSFALYNTSSHDIGRQLPPDSLYIDEYGESSTSGSGLSNFFTHRISQGRHDVLDHLIYLNILTLIIGAVVSYYLARRTLEPIEAAMESQARFSSDASHELRTPLTAMRTRNEVALRKSKLTTSDAIDVIQSNLDEVIKLESLSEGLLRLSRSDGKDLTKNLVAMDVVANEAINQFIGFAQNKNMRIEDKVPKANILGDAGALTRVLSTFLDNAIKYGKDGETIYVEGYTKGNYGYLSVRDDGPGMRASDMPHIFERFYRADNSRSRRGNTGYGLGLSIAKQIIDQHGGEIIVSSTVNEGSTFTIKLPLEESA
jgi:two-component system sensor histidine kinase CiaH